MARGISQKKEKPRQGRSWLWKLLFALFVLLVPAPVLLLLIFRVLPVPGTPEMLVSLIEGKGANYHWTDDISPRLERAVIAAEDQNFCTHHGFDWASINKAVRDHDRHPAKPMRGASTISQQTARTLFLVPMRSWIRKGLEAYLTVLVEGLWPKKRILLAYLNLVDWGDGIFGAEAAANAYFGTDAGSLDGAQAARLAAILPNPHKWKAAHPGRYVRHRSGLLQSRSAAVTRDGLNFCIK
ncbi:MAG TPA: monofunctional biosynthetic peptidoglycan transglycosylase [Rhizomicrobium sp.]|jgi:monofunctional biosynthetic peptidoglycan transglycosylase|nr:monofunctional biosynthetic peptidoglycan transglycosylase [Rhizomicrobium sp.]